MLLCAFFSVNNLLVRCGSRIFLKGWELFRLIKIFFRASRNNIKRKLLEIFLRRSKFELNMLFWYKHLPVAYHLEVHPTPDNRGPNPDESYLDLVRLLDPSVVAHRVLYEDESGKQFGLKIAVSYFHSFYYCTAILLREVCRNFEKLFFQKIVQFKLNKYYFLNLLFQNKNERIKSRSFYG